MDGATDPEVERLLTVPPEPRVFVFREHGGSVSGKLGMCGNGRL